MDWSALITQIEDSGLTQKEIAIAIGCSQPYVSQLKSGQRKGPDFTIGQALVELHRNREKRAAA